LQKKDLIPIEEQINEQGNLPCLFRAQCFNPSSTSTAELLRTDDATPMPSSWSMEGELLSFPNSPAALCDAALRVTKPP
jgi:hypothetical protein